MLKRSVTILTLLLSGTAGYSQLETPDTSRKTVVNSNQIKEFASDTTIDYDLLLKDMESFLDSISSPHNYFLGSLAIGRGYFNFKSKFNSFLETTQQFTYTPVVGYYHKTGLSLTATGNIVNEEDKLDFYQFSITPGYDYLKNRNFTTGITYTRYFTKDSLSFYTTPIQNELFAYFTYRKWWIRPSVAISYGWGSRSDYEERQTLIEDLRLRRNGIVHLSSTESVNDFTVITSLRHDFYWLGTLSYKDHIRFTPQLSFISGTQKFGFNQSASTYGTVIRTGANVLYNSESMYLDDQLEFQPLAVTLFLRAEYSIGKFFIQPLMILDYYFPTDTNNFSTLYSCNFGFVF